MDRRDGGLPPCLGGVLPPVLWMDPNRSVLGRWERDLGVLRLPSVKRPARLLRRCKHRACRGLEGHALPDLLVEVVGSIGRAKHGLLHYGRGDRVRHAKRTPSRCRRRPVLSSLIGVRALFLNSVTESCGNRSQRGPWNVDVGALLKGEEPGRLTPRFYNQSFLVEVAGVEPASEMPSGRRLQA
jgi:hypothetical protein